MENSKLQFILASGSPRRKELIGHLGVEFLVKTLNVPEDCDASDPVSYAGELSLRKGRAVADHMRSSHPDQSFFIVSADTIVSLENRIFNKPSDRNEARSFLNELSGKTHSVFTGVSLHLLMASQVHVCTFVDESQVTFDKISSDIMERYLDTGDSLDKAGAYGIQGPSLTFISQVKGSYSNVVGFPLSRFVRETAEFLKPFYPNEESWLKLF